MKELGVGATGSVGDDFVFGSYREQLFEQDATFEQAQMLADAFMRTMTKG